MSNKLCYSILKYIFYLCSFLFFTTASLLAQKTDVLYLSGKGTDDAVMWDFYCTAGNNSGKWTQIPVPSNWEFHGFGQFTYGHDKKRLNESGMYRHKFTISEHWKGKKVNIVFDGAMTDTEVFVNGKKAGPIHQGAFYCFRYDITKLLKYGKENLLEVTVHKSSSNKSVEAAERKADFWVFGGIFRPVWLEALPLNHIERIAIDAKSSGEFRMNVHLGHKESKAEIVAQVKTLDGKLYGKEIRLDVKNQDVVCLSADYVNPALWSSEFPNRYMVEVSLLKEDEVQHIVTEKFGFRTAELRPRDGFYINGVKIKFKGVNRHTHWPTSGRASNYNLSLNDVLLMKEMNMNAVRMSHYPPDRHFLDVCDSLGMYVIDELTAWQYPPYETSIGKEKVRQLISRDVNHPCVVMWTNGNEGGFNFELLPEYARYDIQKRAVCHPWLEEEYTNTAHYPSYGIGTKFLFQGNKVFFPTECIHGLYDGGHGAGLDDFWNLMQENPLSAGCFLWDFADQAVLRKDKGDILDTDTNHGADGIVGPFREKEGSFYTIKEIWSPVYLEGTNFLPLTFDGIIKVQNRYHFTNLNQCSFKAEWVSFDYKKGVSKKLETDVVVPDVAPGLSGYLKIGLPSDIRSYDALSLTATDCYGKNLYTWTRTITSAQDYAYRLVNIGQGSVVQKEHDRNLFFKIGDTEVIVDKIVGQIKKNSVGGRSLSLKNGPRFTTDELEIFDTKKINNGIRFLYRKKGSNKSKSRNFVQISLLPSGWIEMEYAFDLGGTYDYIGVTFDYPEEKVKRIKWLGNGPFRVWKNRLKGGTFSIWGKDYNNTVTGESWVYPEFKGYHSNLYAADLQTEEGVIQIVGASEDLYLHLFTPESPKGRNNDNTVAKFPSGQLSILNAISPIGTKFKRPKDLGPQGQQNYFHQTDLAEPLRGKFYIQYIPQDGKIGLRKNRIGVCTSVDNSELLQKSGSSFVEVGIQDFFVPFKSDAEFEINLMKAKLLNLPVFAGNNFYPSNMKLVGAEVDLAKILAYTEVVMRRARQAGTKILVLGSGGARRIPDGLDRNIVEQNFVNLCKRIAELGDKYNVTVVIEPLRKQETNFINTVREGLKIVKLVNHPNFKLLADFYHMACEDEDPEIIVEAGKDLYHCHIAEKAERTAPGVKGDDFEPYLKSLKAINYDGSISLECRWHKFKEEVISGIAEIQRQIVSISE